MNGILESIWVFQKVISGFEFSFIVGELCPAELPPLPQMRISLPKHDLLGKERWLMSQRRTRSLFLNGLLLGSICTEIQVKLINHFQEVMIKEFKEL